MPAVTASPVLTQGASGTPGSTAAAAAAAAAAIMQNGAANGPIGSCAVTVVPSTPGIQQVRSNEYIFSKSHFIEVLHLYFPNISYGCKVYYKIYSHHRRFLYV